MSPYTRDFKGPPWRCLLVFLFVVLLFLLLCQSLAAMGLEMI